ncbi:hypothetical protein NIES2109_22690 [Nostoc sp. HK-01]|nr:hypothetical protein NIES2109_22690 [Nostoc sp. HK-01]
MNNLARSAQFSQKLANQIYQSAEQFPVSFDDAWVWLGYSRKDNAKANFIKCGFTEGVDYQLLKSQESVNHSTFSPQQLAAASRKEDIYLTAECLKQWGMMAGTEQGKQVRIYFLKCERIAKAAMSRPQPQIPGNYLEALKALVASEEQKLALTAQVQQQSIYIDELKPKAQAADVLLESKANLTMQEAAQLLNIPGIGRNKLFEVLKKLGYLITSKHPYQKFVDMGVFFVRESISPDAIPRQQILITQKGIQYLIPRLAERGYVSSKLEVVTA